MKGLKLMTEEEFLNYIVSDFRIKRRKLVSHILHMESLMRYHKNKGNSTAYFKKQIEVAEKKLLKIKYND